MRAIVTFARSWSTLAVTRSLGRRGVEVVTGDEHPFAPASFSKYSVASFRYPNPDLEPERFLDVLEEVVRKQRPADGELVLMPIHKEGYLIARHRERFEGLARLALPSIAQIEQVHDKGTLAVECAARGIPIPRTLVPESPEEFRAAAAGFAYPAFVKARRSAGAVGVRKVADALEAVAVFDEFVEAFRLGPGEWPLLQQGVGGDDYCATFLFERGEPRAAMTYHNLRSYPARSGTGVLRETVQAPAIERIGTELLSRLGWHGVAELDFRWDGKGEPWLIEVNPRFWGGLPQAVEAGWDYPWLLYRLAVDGRVDPVPPHETAVRTETPGVGLLSTFQEILDDAPRREALRREWDSFKGSYVRGNRRRALRVFANRFKEATDLPGRWKRAKALLGDHRNAVSDVFRWSDPLPALGFLYPLAIFLRHGRVSLDLLLSEGRAAVRPEASS
jgi:predicted ATP-grasp superfamily ATP-dependent carboligase